MKRKISINLRDVLAFAREKHEGQTRSDGSKYILHPIRVCELVKNNKDSQNADLLMAGALLHDVLEDTYTSYKELEERFGIEVASLVEEVTSAGQVPYLKGKALYLAEKMTYMTSYALYIKLADRYDNLSDLKGISEERRKKTISDTRFIIDYIKTHRELTESHLILIDKLEKKLCELDSHNKRS